MAGVFISFIEEERQVALAVQRLLEWSIVDCKVFVTADHFQMRAGERWLDRIQDELRAAKVFVVILSKVSVGRPWINFEAGAAWLNGARMIPACIGGFNAKDLPKPYNDLHAVTLENESDQYLLVSSTAEMLNAVPPMPFGRIEDEEPRWHLNAALEAVRNIAPQQNGSSAASLSITAQQILELAVQSATGQIQRFAMDQALVIQVNGQALAAEVSEGRRRAELDAALSELERLELIEDISGRRTVFAATAAGYARGGAETTFHSPRFQGPEEDPDSPFADLTPRSRRW